MNRLLFALCALLFSTLSSAKGLSPYLPLNLAPEVELQIEKLIALSGQTPLTKPYKASELLIRLPQIKDKYPLLFNRLNAYLKRYTETSAITHRGIRVSDADHSSRSLENNRGVSHNTRIELSGAGHVYFSPYFYVAGGGMYSDDSGRSLLNTHIGFGNEYAQVDIGYRDHWLSPFQDSAMLMSTQAENEPSITISNATPVSDLQVRYEVFLSQLDDMTIKAEGFEATQDKPYLSGWHFSLSPIDRMSIGYSHTYLFGGGNREDSIATLFKSLVATNQLQDASVDNLEQGYQQSAISAKWNVDWYVPISFYAEFARSGSRNEEHHTVTQYARSIGLYLPSLYDYMSFRYEYTDRDSGWYQSGFYPQGLRNKQHILGHWSADEFPVGEAPGAKTHHLLLDWELLDDQLLALRISGQETDDLPTQSLQDTYQVQARYSFANRYGFWGVEGTYGKDALGDYYHRVSGFFRW